MTLPSAQETIEGQHRDGYERWRRGIDNLQSEGYHEEGLHVESGTLEHREKTVV